MCTRCNLEKRVNESIESLNAQSFRNEIGCVAGRKLKEKSPSHSRRKHNQRIPSYGMEQQQPVLFSGIFSIKSRVMN
ncbi:MAG TPA: hypothetical protein DD473_24925 [Planctomycetaceae bacterium]|nr:hypothetical protein [Planctomycetaceae bacterium]